MCVQHGSDTNMLDIDKNSISIRMIVIRRLVILVMLVLGTLPSSAEKKDGTYQIVIVSSYNPDVVRVSETIYDFSAALMKSGLDVEIVVEDMACKNLPECFEWKDKLWGLLSKYYENGKSPDAILLLGMEAGSAYVSIDDARLKKTPVLMSMRGRQILKLPENDSIDLSSWSPRIYDLKSDFSDYNIIGGTLFDYNVEENIKLIRFFYPKRRSLVFLSDNSWGGLTMRTMFENEMNKFPDYSLRFLDGRKLTFTDVNDSLKKMPLTDVLVVGSWRIDKSNRFVVKNTTHEFAQSTPGLPMFSISSIGFGYWSLAGYGPTYVNSGSIVGNQLVQYLRKNVKTKPVLMDNVYTIDYNKLCELKLSAEGFPYKYELLNGPVDPWEEYGEIIIWVVLIVVFLSTCLGISLHFLRKSHVLGKQLQHYNRQLDVARRKAEEASVMKSNFIGNMSHEIRTPLNAIVGFAQLLADPNMEVSSEEKIEFGSIIRMNTDLLLNLVNDSLELSRIDAGHVQFKCLPIDIVELYKMAAEQTRANLSPEVSLVTEFNSEKLIVKSDKDKLLQVLFNLLNNAKKFTEHGKITVSVGSVHHDLSAGKNMVDVSVSDTGCGVPLDKVDVIFERFAKVDEFKQGTGLGLAVARSIVNSLGGRIWVDTDYTDGARFVFTIPVENVA